MNVNTKKVNVEEENAKVRENAIFTKDDSMSNTNNLYKYLLLDKLLKNK